MRLWQGARTTWGVGVVLLILAGCSDQSDGKKSSPAGGYSSGGGLTGGGTTTPGKDDAGKADAGGWTDAGSGGKKKMCESCRSAIECEDGLCLTAPYSICSKACQVLQDCPADYTCLPTNQPNAYACIPRTGKCGASVDGGAAPRDCLYSTDCRFGEVCDTAAHKCQKPCTTDIDCAQGQICVYGYCA
jgi:hypothetical protein